jgi:hypothetical protein
MKNRITSNNIEELNPNEVFVFGSNLSGIHGAGAARTALRWGAKMGVSQGLQGQSYAIPTKDRTIKETLSLQEISTYVDEYVEFAKAHPQYTFLTTEIGCGLAGLTPQQVAPLFKKAVDVVNIHLPERFWRCLKNSSYL